MSFSYDQFHDFEQGGPDKIFFFRINAHNFFVSSFMKNVWHSLLLPGPARLIVRLV